MTTNTITESEPNYSEFSDPKLVAIYDTVNPIAADTEFYCTDLATQLSAVSIIDLGAGTGLLTCELAKRGHHMTGVEPSDAMLAIARTRPYGDEVQWIGGSASKLDDFPDLHTDLAIMTGHVAQFFVEDDEWHSALLALHKSLKPGGHIAFESRNPAVQPWSDDHIKGHIDWPSQTSRKLVNDPVAGDIEWWTKPLTVKGERVLYENHYLFKNSGEELISTNELRFRTRAELEDSLVAAGFTVEDVFGYWDRRPADDDSPELIFVAIKS